MQEEDIKNVSDEMALESPTEAAGMEENVLVEEYEPAPSDDEVDDGQITAEKLRENTFIGGWLAFFLYFGMMGGSIISIFINFSEFNRSEVGGNWFLALADPIFAVMLFFLAFYTLYSFIKRRPDAVFLAKTYVVAVFVSGVLVLIGNSIGGGGADVREIIRPLIWGTIWFVFLGVSTRVESVIPTEYRRTGKKDWWIVGALIAVPVLCIVIGILQLMYNANMHEKQDAAFLENVVLRNGEYTDGRVVFTCPPLFGCEKIEGEDVTVYSMETSTQGIMIVSEYNTDDSQRCADTYWKASTENDLKSFRYSSIQDEVQKINGNKVFIKIGRYESMYALIDGSFVYRRFALMFNEKSGKMCLVNCYDQGNDYYFETFLKKIRFE